MSWMSSGLITWWLTWISIWVLKKSHHFSVFPSFPYLFFGFFASGDFFQTSEDAHSVGLREGIIPGLREMFRALAQLPFLQKFDEAEGGDVFEELATALFGRCPWIILQEENSGSNWWRYVNVAYFWPYFAGIFPYIGLKNRPYWCNGMQWPQCNLLMAESRGTCTAIAKIETPKANLRTARNGSWSHLVTM